MSDPTFGVSITRIDNEPRPPVWSDMSVVGIIGTAPDADASVFPADTPVFHYSDDAAKLTALGDAGTLKDALVILNAQLGEFQVAAKVVLIEDMDTDDFTAISEVIAGFFPKGTASATGAPSQPKPHTG